MLKAFDGIHGKIALALAGSGLALSAAVCLAGGAAARPDSGSRLTRVTGAASASLAPRATTQASGRSRPEAGRALPGAVLTAALSGMAASESALLGSRRAQARRSPRQIARWLLTHRFHWRRWQFKYLNLLWDRESGWNRRAENPYSGAYGIPQAVPGVKMASAGPDWRHSARTQIRWGMRYIRGRYRTPYWAWRHEVGYGWY